MDTERTTIQDSTGAPILGSEALLWGNNAAWKGLIDGLLYGNRTGDTEYIVQSPEPVLYEILRGPNKSGLLHLGAATGVRALNVQGGRAYPFTVVGGRVIINVAAQGQLLRP